MYMQSLAQAERLHIVHDRGSKRGIRICGCPGRLPMACSAPIVPHALPIVWRMKNRS